MNGINADVRLMRRQAVLALISAAACSALALYVAYSASASSRELATRVAGANAIAVDIQAIEVLQQHPRQAGDLAPSSADLLERVDRALDSVGTDPQVLVSTNPQPVRRVAGTDLAEFGHRLVLENVPLEAIVRFLYELVRADPALRVSSLELHAAQSGGRWNVDLELSYRALAPAKGTFLRK